MIIKKTTTKRKVVSSFRKKSGKKPVTLAKKVRAIIQRTEEKKVAQVTGTLIFGAYTSSSLVNNINPVTPYVPGIQILPGTGQGDRIGNKIRTVSHTINGVIVPNGYDAVLNPTPSPQEVRVWFFSLRNSNTLPATLPGFFQAGSSSQTPTGNLLDLTRKINTDVYIYRGHRTYKLGNSINAASAGSLVARDHYANNDFKYNIKFNWNLTSMVPKNVTFNDSNNTATSKAVFWFIETVNADGTAQPAAALPATIYYTNMVTYTDD